MSLAESTPVIASEAPSGRRAHAAIPVLDCSADFAMDSLNQAPERLAELMQTATHKAPRSALRLADAISRRWLVRSGNRYLAEIDRVAARVNRPGTYFFSINYEWGCTCRVAPSPDKRSARLARVLDWRTPGLGRNIVAVRVQAAAGPFVTLTWPGYTGVLQGLAPGRFTAALNQAPLRPLGGGLYATDWAMSKARVWRVNYTTPAHLLRTVFETAPSYVEARRMLIETPIAAPAIFSLAGLSANETTVIERVETAAKVHDGIASAANHWQAPGWQGRARGDDSAGRAAALMGCEVPLEPQFPWLTAPILNDRTRLVMVASASEGRLVAQGYESDGPATLPLDLRM